jgi:FlaA1/EpsC-like NDP-sugar epimerase
VYEDSYKEVTTNIEVLRERLESLKDIPIIIWGCGDIAMHLLTQVKLNIIHFVDIDPAFKNSTIMGIPVLDHVEGDYPIVIMAMGQRDGILHHIKNLGLTNEVVVI